MALLIDAADDLFGFLLRPWVDVAQQTIHGEHADPDQVGRILHGLWWQAIHVTPILSRLADPDCGGPRRPPPNAEIPKKEAAAEAGLGPSGP